MSTSDWSSVWSSTTSSNNPSSEGEATTANNSYIFKESANSRSSNSSWSSTLNSSNLPGVSSASTSNAPSLITKAISVNSTNNYSDTSLNDYSTTSGTDLNSLLDGYTNPLLVGENVSWRCKIFAISSTDFADYQESKDPKEYTQFILAETGVTSHYSIDEVSIKSLPSGTEYTKNGTMTSMIVKITETGSMKLFDDLQLGVQALGYGSSMADLPLFVEIAFVGYNSSTHLPYTLPETRLWACGIANSTCRVASGGSQTVYEITLLRHIGSNVMNTKDHSGTSAGQNIEFNAPSTFGEAIKELQKQCNKSLAAIYPNWPQKFANKVTNSSYITFNVDPELAKLPILTDSQQDTATDKTNHAPSAKKFTFNSSSTYANMIDSILDSVKHPDDTKDKIKRVFADVITENIYLGYDDDHNGGAYAVKIHIVNVSKYESQTVKEYRDENTVSDLIAALQAGHKKGSNMRIKRYDYLWSGLNTEILRFDFNFNTAASMAITRNIVGLYDSHNRKGAKNSKYTPVDPISDGRETRAYGATTTTRQNKSSKDESDNTVTQKLNTSSTTKTEGESLQNTIMQFLNPTSKKTKIYTFDDLDAGYDAGMPISPRFSNKNIRENTSGTDDSNSHKAEIEKRMIRSNYYNSSTLISISIDVVGDPHWLGPSDQNINKAMIKVMNANNQLNAQSSKEISKTADIDFLVENLRNETCFVLNLYPAKYYNQNTGIATQDPDGVLAQCLYRVVSIDSKFSGSGFKQTLQANCILKSLNQ